MGRINIICEPKYWEICLEGKNRIIEGDIVYKMIIGKCEDYQSYEITEFISKSNYDKLIKGDYFIKSFPYSELPILLFNEHQQLISLVIGSQINFDKLSEEQKKYINNFDHKEKILIKK